MLQITNNFIHYINHTLGESGCFVLPAAAGAVHAETLSAGNRCRTAELLLEQQISPISHFEEDKAVERPGILPAAGFLL